MSYANDLSGFKYGNPLIANPFTKGTLVMGIKNDKTEFMLTITPKFGGYSVENGGYFNTWDDALFFLRDKANVCRVLEID